MSAPARALASGHYHLPSVHVRAEHGVGFDYEEDVFSTGRGPRRRVERVIRLAIIDGGQETLIRVTRDELSPEELASLEERLSFLMDEADPEAAAIMEQRARDEFARQLRIEARQEHACRVCGCSESRGCSVGCIWAGANLCSRCARLPA